MMVELNKEKKSMMMMFLGDAGAGAAGVFVATHLLYNSWIIIKGHHCLSHLNMKDLTELFCIKNEIGLGAEDLS
jgi:hypothetical protein